MHGISQSVPGTMRLPGSNRIPANALKAHRDEQPTISTSSRNVIQIPLTKEMFFEEYGTGKANLSVVECPECMKGTTFLKAPEAYNEAKRLNAVERYISLPQWENSGRFNFLLKKMQSMFNTSGASISIVNARYQLVKYQQGLGFTKCARQISLDAHAILSSQFFALADASKDWRTESNPLVKSLPYIKYYVSVPLVTKQNNAIGALAIFDSFPREGINENTVLILNQMANEIMQYLEEEIKPVPKAKKGDQPTGTVGARTFGPNGTSKLALMEKFGRATSWDPSSSIIFEKDGSGSSYQNHTQLRFSRYYHPYDDIIDLGVWKQVMSCRNFRVASNLLSRILMDRLAFHCVYILQLQVSRPGRIQGVRLPREREINLDTFKHESKVEVCGDESVRFKLLGIQGLYDIDSNWEQQFHFNAFNTNHGVIYQSSDSKMTFRSGLCMPLFRLPEKMVKRDKVSSNTSRPTELYLRHGGYLIGCFSTNNRDITEAEIGYIYGCASILRRLYLMN